MIRFSLQSNVTIIDNGMEVGTYCQDIAPPTYESTGQNLTVIFKADGQFNNYYGFNATYTCIGSLTTSPPAGLGFVKKEQKL